MEEESRVGKDGCSIVVTLNLPILSRTHHGFGFGGVSYGTGRAFDDKVDGRVRCIGGGRIGLMASKGIGCWE